MWNWLTGRSKLKAENEQLRAAAQAMGPETVYDRLGGGSSGYSAFSLVGGTDMSTDDELVRHFRLWNYVAISRICYKIAESYPNVSRTIETREATQRLTVSQRQHIRKRYGFVMQSHEDLEPVDDGHPLVRMLHSVNPEDWWGTFIYETVMFWQLTGEFYWWIIPNQTGLPAEMWVLPTQWVETKYNKDGEIAGYEVTPDGDARRKNLIPPEQIITGKHKSPISKNKAHSPTAAGSEWIDNAESVESARWNTFQNGPLPSVSIELDPEQYAKPDPDVLRAVKDRFVARYGGTARAGEPMIAPPGMKVTPFSMKPSEMDFPDTIDQVRDQVLALHGVPKVIAGITTDVNRATIYGANLIFCESTINPLLSLLAGIMTEKLAPRFGEGLRIWFDDARPADAEAEREETRLDWAMGAITPNERRMERGRDPIDDKSADSVYLPMSVMPIGTERTEDGELESPEEEIIDEDDVLEEDEQEDLGGEGQHLNGERRNGKAQNGHDQHGKRNGQRGNGHPGAGESAGGHDAGGVARTPGQGKRRTREAGQVGRQGQGQGARTGTSADNGRRTGRILTPDSVWQARRNATLLNAWHRTQKQQERVFRVAVERYFSAFGNRALKRLSGRNAVDVEFIPDLLGGVDDLDLWKKDVGPAYAQSLVAGAVFEMGHLGIESPSENRMVLSSVAPRLQAEEDDPWYRTADADEFLETYPGTPDIFVDMPPEMREEIVQYLEGQ